MERINLKLKDCTIIGYEQDNYSYGGCEACDYGSHYVTSVKIEVLVNDGNLKLIELSTSHEYDYNERLTTGKLIKLFTNLNDNMNFNDLLNAIDNMIVKATYDDYEMGREYYFEVKVKELLD